MGTDLNNADLVNRIAIMVGLTPKTYPSINEAFELLKGPSSDHWQVLRIALSVLVDGEKSRLAGGILQTKAELLRWVIMAALELNEQLFKPFGDELRKCFIASSKSIEDKRDLDLWSRNEDLIKMANGQILHGLSKKQLEALSFLQDGCPVIWWLNNAGLGDTIMLVPLVRNLIQTCKVMGYKNRFFITVNQKIERLVSHMIGQVKGIKVTYVQSAHDFAVQEVKWTERCITICWSYDRSCPAPIRNGLVFEIGENNPWKQTDESDSGSIGSFLRFQQILLSNRLGIKIFDNNIKQDIVDSAVGIESFVNEYAGENKDFTYKDNDIATGNRYICIALKGSNGMKQLSEDMLNLIADEIKSFCVVDKIGIVLLSDIDSIDVNKHQAIFKNLGITCEVISDNKPIAEFVTAIINSVGMIGPDTFFTHLAEFFPSKISTLNIFTVSSSLKYRLLPSRIGALHVVEHPIVSQATRDHVMYMRKAGQLYSKEVSDFFAISSEKINLYTPIIHTIQSNFAQQTKEKLKDLLSSIVNNRPIDCPGC